MGGAVPLALLACGKARTNLSKAAALVRLGAGERERCCERR